MANWPTNADNDFRVTTSQALIGALNKAFDAADPTLASLPLSAADSSHAQPGTSCFQCHRLMDPMKEVFKNLYADDEYRYRRPASTPSGFAFFGVNRPLSDLRSFGRTLADHPQFVSGWAQKICSYFNSQPCLESDPEFIEIVSAARVGAFDLQAMFRRFAQSRMVTGHRYSKMYENKAFLISASRENHLCQAVAQRTNNLRQWFDQADLAESGQYCSQRAASLPKLIFSRDQVSRGDAGFVQPTSQSAFRTRAAETFCVGFGNFISPEQAQGFLPVNTPEGRTESFVALAESLLGYSKAHPRQALVIEAMSEMWQQSFDASSITQTLRKQRFAMAKVVEMACLMPEIQAVGF